MEKARVYFDNMDKEFEISCKRERDDMVSIGEIIPMYTANMVYTEDDVTSLTFVMDTNGIVITNANITSESTWPTSVLIEKFGFDAESIIDAYGRLVPVLKEKTC